MQKNSEIGPEKTDRSAGSVTPGANNEGRRFGFVEVIVAAVTYFVVQIVFVAGGIVALGIQPEQILAGGQGTLLLVATAAVSALAAALVADVIRVRSLAALGLVGTSGRWLLIGAGAGLAGFLVNRVVIVLYVWLSGDSSNPQQGMADTAMGGSWGQFALLVILGGLITPFGEELLFRGVLFGWLRKWGFVLALVASSVVFGLAHGVNVVLPAAIVLGLLNAYVYERSGSVWPAVISHAVNNVLVFAIARVVAETGLMQ